MMNRLIKVLVFFYNNADEGKSCLDLSIRNTADLKSIDPVYKFGGGRLLPYIPDITDLIENIHSLSKEMLFNLGEVHSDDLFHEFPAGELDIMENTSSEERIGKFLFGI